MRLTSPELEKVLQEEEAQGFVRKARELRPLLESHAQQHEDEGEISESVIQALDESGLLKMAAPRRWGGLCVTSVTMADVAIELARGCPSTSWVMSIINSSVWMASRIPPEVQRRIFANGVPKMCSPVFNPASRIERDGDGYRLSGSGGYASASHHADWTIVKVGDADGVRYGVIVPMSDVKISRTWYVTGMKGTGSDTIVYDNVRVAEDQVFKMQDLYGGYIKSEDAFPLEMTDNWIAWPLLRTKMLGVLIGSAEGLLEQAIAGSSRPQLYTIYSHKKDSAVFQAVIGEASAGILSARHLMHFMARMMDQRALEGLPLTLEERAEIRGITSKIVSLLNASVARLIDLIGSSAFNLSHPAQRYWRDFHMAIHHQIFTSDVSYEVYGAQLLGSKTKIIDDEVL